MSKEGGAGLTSNAQQRRSKNMTINSTSNDHHPNQRSDAADILDGRDRINDDVPENAIG